MSKEWAPSDIFDVLGCPVARQLLAAAAKQPQSASELSVSCGISPATVYRRLEALERFGLVTHELEPARDGHHRKRFTTDVTQGTLQIGPDGVSVDFAVDREYQERFADFWRDLSTATEGLRPDTPTTSGMKTFWGHETGLHE